MHTNTADTVSVDIKVPAEMPEFSEDLTYSPRMRVVRVGQSLKAWRVADQTFESDPATPDGIEQTVLGMLADLRFLCDEHGLDFARIDRMAYGDYMMVKEEARREAKPEIIVGKLEEMHRVIFTDRQPGVQRSQIVVAKRTRESFKHVSVQNAWQLLPGRSLELVEGIPAEKY